MEIISEIFLLLSQHLTGWPLVVAFCSLLLSYFVLSPLRGILLGVLAIAKPPQKKESHKDKSLLERVLASIETSQAASIEAKHQQVFVLRDIDKTLSRLLILAEKGSASESGK